MLAMPPKGDEEGHQNAALTQSYPPSVLRISSTMTSLRSRSRPETG